jgi:RND family efflux transporter MFP subunit
MCPLISGGRSWAWALLAILCAAGCREETASQTTPPPNVTVGYPSQRILTDFDEYNGWTAPSAVVEVRSRVRGHIDEVKFEDGQMVALNRPLFILDLRPFQSDIDRAQENVKVAVAQQAAAAKEEERQNGLWEERATTKQLVEKAVAMRESWDAEVAQAEEELQRAELEKSYATITAPIAGRVSRAQLTHGNLVNAGGSDPLLTTIVKSDPVWVYFSVDERALLEYRENDPVTTESTPESNILKSSKIPFAFRLETDTDWTRSGFLEFAENRIDSSTGTIEVRGASDNPSGAVIPGSRVRVRVPVSDEYVGLLVPDQVIQSDQDKKYVLILNEEKVVVRRDVRLGKLLEDGMRVILPGADEASSLNLTDRLIVDGIQRARISYPVEPMGADGKPFQQAPPKPLELPKKPTSPADSSATDAGEVTPESGEATTTTPAEIPPSGTPPAEGAVDETSDPAATEGAAADPAAEENAAAAAAPEVEESPATAEETESDAPSAPAAPSAPSAPAAPEQ